jgi:hypothetical protein
VLRLFPLYTHTTEGLLGTGTRNRDAVLHTPARPLRDVLRKTKKGKGRDTTLNRNFEMLTYFLGADVTEDRSHSLILFGMSFFHGFRFLLYHCRFSDFPSCQNINMTLKGCRCALVTVWDRDWA